MRKKSLGLIPVLFFVMLFLFTAQHDPNIIPWSRRYIYLVLPILFIGFSYIFDGLPKRLNIISSIALLTFSLVSFYPSASLVMNKAEYADTEGFIQLIESSIPAGSRIIIDSKNDQSVVQNLRFCETFEIVLDLQCDYSIKEVEILDTSRFDYYVTMENLLDYRLYLSAKYRLDLVSYPVEYYEWPDDVRSAVFDVLVYKT